MNFNKKSKVDPKIPDASLPDIVFMLLIFFMVSTVFKESDGLNIILPDAKKIEKLKGKRDIATIWADKAGNVSIDDKIVEISQLRTLVYTKVADPLHPMKRLEERH